MQLDGDCMQYTSPWLPSAFCRARHGMHRSAMTQPSGPPGPRKSGYAALFIATFTLSFALGAHFNLVILVSFTHKLFSSCRFELSLPFVQADLSRPERFAPMASAGKSPPRAYQIDLFEEAKRKNVRVPYCWANLPACPAHRQ